VKSCATCRCAGCRNYGKDLDSCMNYITSLEEERRIKIEQFACKDMRARDSDYNTGLRRIRKIGYNECKGEREVKYYCLCNNL
jgi:hypothetical protein